MTSRAFTSPQAAIEHYKLVEKAGYNLAPLQLYDLNQSVMWDRVKWFYEVGVGKTVCSTVQAWMIGCSHHLVLVPPILIPQWVSWLKKVDCDSVLAYKGTPKQRKVYDLKAYRWVIMSYGIFREDFVRLLAELGPSHPHVIVDEAHNLKNSASQLYKKLLQFVANNPLQLLTGTPTSKPTDAYAYIKLTNPELYRSYAHFESMHVGERDFFGNIVAYNNMPLLQQNLAIQSLKRSKEEMFPGIIAPRYQVLEYELADKHKALYKKLAEEQLLLLDNGGKIDATTAQRLYHALQQIVINLDYFSGNPEARSTAYDLIDETIEETQCMKKGKSKLIIWTYYKRTSASILEYLSGWRSVGAYSGANSNKSVQQFMNDPGCRILVAQPMSAGLGLEPQHVCWENLFLEHSTVPLHFVQSVGRTDRKGQKHMPTMRVAVAKDTIQAPLHDRLLHNGDLVKQTEGNLASIRDAIYGKI